MSYRELFNRIRTSLSSPEAYSSFQKELDSKAIEQTLFNKFAGKTSFRAVVMPENPSSTSNVPDSKIIRVRPLDIHDFILPEPCAFSDARKIKRVLSMHPVAYPDSSYSVLGGNAEDTDAVGYGHIVECFFKDGPQSDGNLRGLTYRPSTIGLASDFNMECLGVEIDTSGGGGGGGSLASTNPKKASAAQIAFTRDKYQPYQPPPPGLVLGPFDLDTQVTSYVVNSTVEKIKTYETVDGKRNSPRKLIYVGSVEAYKGKEIKNGLLPKEILGQLPADIVAPSGTSQLKGIFIIDVISDLQRLAMAFEKRFGQKIQLTDSYRTFNRQVSTKNARINASKTILAKIKEGMTDKQKKEIQNEARLKKKEAAMPGTSPHGWALAFDMNTHYGGTSGFASETVSWIITEGPKYNFHSPPGLRDGKGLEEWWHFEYMYRSRIYKKV